MPPFVPPPHPPALIHPLTSPTASDPLPVVEVYYADPKQIPENLSLQPFQPTGEKAESLGRPISVGLPLAPEFTPVPSSTIEEVRDLDGRPDSPGKVLVAQNRGGKTQKFALEGTPPTPAPVATIELIADRQEYDSEQQVVTATGNVVMRFGNAVLLADRLQVNLPDRVAVAEGNVVLERGEQGLRGERFEYYFVQDRGVVINARGEIYQPTAGSDFSPSLPTDLGTDLYPNQTLSERLALNQPLQRVATGQGYKFVVGTAFDLERAVQGTSGERSGGSINRIRFEAERLDFNAERWNATDVRLTNDPFSPPEVEIRAKTATYRNVAPLVDEIVLDNSEVVLDQENSFPTFQDRIVLDRRSRQPGVVSFGYDERDRGGLYLQRSFRVVDTDAVTFQVTPQFFLQRAFFSDTSPTVTSINQETNQEEPVNPLGPSSFGFTSNLSVNFSPRTSLAGEFYLTSLNFPDVTNRVRARLSLQQKLGDLNDPYDLRFQYIYRERLFNGSLGFQTVNNSIGPLLVSPPIPLGESGINLSYQASILSIQAPTDRSELIRPNLTTDNLATLMRYQGAASLNKSFFLWLGQALPPTPEEGLRYTSTPVLPYLQLNGSLTGVTSFYSNGDSQPSLTGTVGLQGQFGHFSQSWFDYTGFNLAYSQAIRGSTSPFLFDRFVDTKVLYAGLTQQIYGPVRVGLQSAYSLETNREISTDLFVEYSRRTYNILLRYNIELRVGSINLRISDFNWSGYPGPFDGTAIRPVVGGVVR